MPRYIDSDKLIDKMCDKKCHSERKECQMGLPCMMVDLVENAPTAPVESVVHCGECKLHGLCTFEETFLTAGLAENKRFCGAGTREDEKNEKGKL